MLVELWSHYWQQVLPTYEEQKVGRALLLNKSCPFGLTTATSIEVLSSTGNMVLHFPWIHHLLSVTSPVPPQSWAWQPPRVKVSNHSKTRVGHAAWRPPLSSWVGGPGAKWPGLLSQERLITVSEAGGELIPALSYGDKTCWPVLSNMATWVRDTNQGEQFVLLTEDSFKISVFYTSGSKIIASPMSSNTWWVRRSQASNPSGL